MKSEDIISDEEIDLVHGNANFGGRMSNREVVNLGVLKCASGYHQGHTSMMICMEHKLISKTYKVTEKGRRYLWSAFGDGKF